MAAERLVVAFAIPRGSDTLAQPLHWGADGKRLSGAASDFTLHQKKECVAMSDPQKKTFDPNELRERLSSLRARFDEFRGRL